MRHRRVLAGAAVAVGTVGAAVVVLLPPFADARLNGIHRSAAATGVSAEVAARHARLTICDLHADPLLWGRDLMTRARRGHVDHPRLVQGNVALQVMGVVTQAPRGLNMARNEDKGDLIRIIAMVSRWPPRTWGSRLERALHQAARLRAMVDRSQGRLVLIRTAADLRKLLDARRTDRTIVGVMLALEGAHALEGDVKNVDRLFEAGFRMMAPSHFIDSDMGGSSAGVAKHGLTEKGRAMVRRMEELGMTVDLAHASPSTIDDVLALATRPVVVSHTGIAASCPSPRNLSDAHVRAIASKGGVIGIGFFSVAVCGDSPDAIARAVVRAVALAGPDRVALGSDWDGAVATPFDAAGLPELTAALEAAGVDSSTVERVMGGNVLALLARTLP